MSVVSTDLSHDGRNIDKTSVSFTGTLRRGKAGQGEVEYATRRGCSNFLISRCASPRDLAEASRRSLVETSNKPGLLRQKI